MNDLGRNGLARRGSALPLGAWVPIAVLALGIALLATFPIERSFEAHLLLPALNGLFVSVVSVVVALLAARSFLVGGSVSLLPMGAGMLIIAVASIWSSLHIAADRVDDGVTVYNAGMWLGSLAHLVAIVLLALPPTDDRSRPRPRWAALVGAYLVAMVAITAVELERGAIPPFYVEGQGFTQLRRVVLSAAMAQFMVAAIVMLLASRRSESSFMSWYGLGLLLLALGLGGVSLARSMGTPLNWVGRGAQYVAGLYLLMAVVQAVRGSRAWMLPLELLRETHERYRSLVQFSPDPIVVHAEGRWVYANPAAAALFGVAGPEELIGREVMESVDPGFRAEALGRMQQAYAERAATPLRQSRMRRVDGSAFDVEAASVGVEYDGRPAVLVVMRDITQRLRAVEEMQAAQRAAEEANRAKDRFLAVLSHELRTPLTPVLLKVSALEAAGLGAEQREELSIIRRNIELEARLIDDLLDLSRVLSGKLRMHPHPTRLHEVLAHALETCEAEIASRRLRVKRSLAAEHDWVNGDAPRLQQVFWNILANAVKFTPEGGEIEIVSACADGRVRVSIRDSGAGILAEALERIFDAFEQAHDGSSNGTRGLGLGLAICRSIVEAHGGSIRAESAGLGMGSTFTVELPLTSAPSEPAGGHEAPQEGAGERRGLKLLVVEDHADTARALSRLLEVNGHSVRMAMSAAEAVNCAAGEAFDLVLSDVGLPDRSGYELMAELRGRFGLRGIAMTGYGMEEDVQRGREAGFSEHLVKPVNVTLLEQAIRRVAGSR